MGCYGNCIDVVVDLDLQLIGAGGLPSVGDNPVVVITGVIDGTHGLRDAVIHLLKRAGQAQLPKDTSQRLGFIHHQIFAVIVDDFQCVEGGALRRPVGGKVSHDNGLIPGRRTACALGLRKILGLLILRPENLMRAFLRRGCGPARIGQNTRRQG